MSEKNQINNKRERTTKCSSNKGFIDNSSFLPHSNFGVAWQARSPQSLTAAILNR